MEMKNQEHTNVYSSSEPPPYTGPQPSYGPTAQPGPTHTVIHPTSTTVIHTPGIITPIVSTVVVKKQMTPSPTVYVCPSCNQQIVTRVEYKPSTKTHLFAVLLCIVFWPCVCLPYCTNTCKDADHYCPNCNAYLGLYSR